MRQTEVKLISMVLAGLASWAMAAKPPVIGSGLSHQVYLWQRDWSPSVQQAISQHAGEFDRLVVLNAEVTWVGKEPRLVRVLLNYAALSAVGRPIGLALRIGPFAGPFQDHGEPIESLCRLARSLVEEAQTHQLTVAELQIDFDCAESKLAGYRSWVRELRRRVAPTPVCITALPSWLPRDGFKALIAESGNYVLQVHSLERPKNLAAPFVLCDSAAAKRAVELAITFGVPFRVALPTYGYAIGFDRRGKYLGLSAEGLPKSWPPDAQIREVLAEPGEISELVRFWSTNRPAFLQGLIWYRLPVSGDRLNWPWPTLASVMHGRILRDRITAKANRTDNGLVQIELANEGDLECFKPPEVRVRWLSGRLIAGDALEGFEMAELSSRSVRFQATGQGAQRPRLGPGTVREVGWLRLSVDQEVQIESANSE